MPLKEGKKAVGSNIKELVKHGHKRSQAIAIALDKAGLSNEKAEAMPPMTTPFPRIGKQVSANKQVLIKRKLLNGNNELIRCNVLSEANGIVRCQIEGQRGVKEVKASDTIPAQQIYGPRNSQTQIQSSPSPARYSFANLNR